LPKRYFRITGSSLDGVTRENLLAPGDKPVFFVLSIDGRVIGRSKLFDDDIDHFSLEGDGTVDWSYACFLSTDGPQHAVTIEIAWYAERGDLAPRLLSRDTNDVTIDFWPAPRHDSISCALEFSKGTCSWDSHSAKVPRAQPQISQVQRLHAPSQSGAVVATDRALVTELTAVSGLYKPGAPATFPLLPRLAMPVAGYKSEDDLGRVYLSHDLDGDWTPETQLIELTAQVHVIGANLGANTLRVDWYLILRRDPSMDGLHVHRDAAAMVDTGEPEWPEDPWEEVEAYALSDADEDAATTRLDGQYRSSVRLRCPSVGGAHFAVRAVARFKLDDAREDTGALFSSPITPRGSGASYEIGDTTGVMATWKRVSVEYRKMGIARDLLVDQVPPHFEPAFIQLDFLPVEACADDLEYLGEADEAVSEVTRRCVEAEFGHKDTPGFFCVVAAREFTKPKPLQNNGRSVYADEFSFGHHGEYQNVYYDRVDFLPGEECEIEDIEGVRFEWKPDPQVDRWISIDFEIRDIQEGNHSWLRGYLVPRQVTRTLTQEMLNGKDCYASAHRVSMTGYQHGATWTAGGFPLPAGDYPQQQGVEAYLAATLSGDFTFSGWSPDLVHDNEQYFAGRTVIATLDQGFVTWNQDRTNYQVLDHADEDAIITIIHELCHGFGMPHECGYWDHRTPRDKSCVLNYAAIWMMDDTMVPQLHSARRVGRHLCGFHIQALRRVRLEDNPGLMAAWGFGGDD
jgi:hypothetical protein